MRALIMFFVFVFAGPSLVQAQSDNVDLDAIIDRVDKVYKVDRLKKARTIRLEQDIRRKYPDHDYGPDFHDLASQRRHFIMDFKSQSGASEYLTKISNSHFHGRSILVDGKQVFVDYILGNYQDQGETEFFAEYGPVVRGSDVLLAYALVTSQESARHSGQEAWLGKSHDKVTFEFPNTPPLTVFVDTDTSYITKMERSVGEGTLVSYTYDNHYMDKGQVGAREHSVYANGEPLYYSINQRHVLNDRKDRREFEIDKGFELEPERVDQSAMTVEALDDTTYHVGQDEAYSTFIKTNSGLVAFGLAAGFSDRLTAYREETGETGQLAYAIAADHHDGKWAGAADAAQQGATLITTKDAAPRIRDALAESAPNAVIETVGDRKTIDTMTIFRLSTADAANVLVALSGDKLMQAGHYASFYKDEAINAMFPAVTMYNALEKFDISPNFVVSMSSRRPEDWSAMEAAVKAYKPTPCFHNRRICKGL